MFRNRSGFNLIEFDGVPYLVMRRTGVLGVVCGEDAKDVKALFDNVFLNWDFSPTYFTGTDILKPQNYKEAHYTGTVCSVGPEVENLKAGDRICFDQFCGVQKFEEDDKRYAFITEGDVYCIVPNRTKDNSKEYDYNKLAKIANQPVKAALAQSHSHSDTWALVEPSSSSSSISG